MNRAPIHSLTGGKDANIKCVYIFKFTRSFSEMYQRGENAKMVHM